MLWREPLISSLMVLSIAIGALVAMLPFNRSISIVA
jgi:hypothetical protein